MGYRSDIYLKADKTLAFELKAFLTDWETKYDLKGKYERTSDSNYIYVLITDWKFYSDYPEVFTLTDFVSSFTNDKIGMIAIGEDGAITEWGTPYEVNLWVETNIAGFNN